MNLTEFFNSIQKYGDGSFSFPVLNDFLTTPNNPDITNFFDLYKQDNRLASSVDSKKYAKVIGKILEDHKSYGGDPASITSALQKNPNKMTISSMDVRNLNLPAERMHKFTINVSGVLLYDVVEKIYDFAKELDYVLDMEIPAAKDQKLGLTDTIILYSSNNNLFNTLDFIQKLKTISNSFGEQPKYTVDREKKSYYAEITDGIAYDSYNAEHQKWNRDVVGETIIEAIDNMIVNFVADNFDLYGNADSINYKNDRVKIIRDMMNQDIDVYVTFNSYLEKGFKAKNIDPDNIYLSETVREKFFGPRVNIVDALEEEFGKKYDEQDDLEEAIEQMTSDLLSHIEELGLEETGEQHVDLDFNEEEVAEQVEGDSLNLLGEQEEDFTPLVENLERVDPENVHVLGLNPNPLNPLEYLTPVHPTANLRRLDELNLDNNIGQNQGQEEQALDVETLLSGKEQEEVQEEINISDVSEEEIVEEKSLDEQPHFGENITLSNVQEEVIEGEVPDGEVLEEQPQFGDNITVPGAIEEAARDLAQSIIPEGEELDSEQRQVVSAVGEIFGEGIMNDFIMTHEEGEKDEHQEEEKEEIGTQEDQEKIDVQTALEPEKDKNSLLREFQAKRAAEIAAMEEASDKNDLVLTSSNIGERLGSGVSQEPNPNETYLDQLLETTLNGTNNSVLEAEEETFKRTEYTHVPSDEEIRLLELEQGKGLPKSDELLMISPTPVRDNYVPPEKGEAELYLESVLEKALNSNKTSEFTGFEPNMLLDEADVDAELTPSSVFEDSIAKVESAEEKKSPAEKRIEAMLAAIDKQKNNATGVSQGEGVERQPYHHEKTDEEKRLEDILNNAITNPVSSDYTGFDDKLFTEADDQEVVEDSAKLLGLSSENASSDYLAAQAKRREEEERFDAMLRGEYQPPAVVIEKIETVQPYKREKTAEELRLEEMLSNTGKEVPTEPYISEFDTFESMEPERTPYQQEKSENELALEQTLIDALAPKKPILGSIKDEMTNVPKLPSSVTESESYLENLLNATINGTGQEETQEEFTGFGDLVGGQDNLETALDADDVAQVAETEVDEAKRALTEQEEYLNNLLSNLPDPNEARQAAMEEKPKIVPVTVERNQSEEELRLQEVEAEALAPKEPVLGAMSEIQKTPVIPNSEPNAEESYLNQLLDMSENLGNQGDSQFTGFTPEMQGSAQLEYAGQQGLLALSLEEKINQIAAMELRKNQHERNLDRELQQVMAGSNGETSLIPVQPQQVSVLRNIMEESMAQEGEKTVDSDNNGKSDVVKAAEELLADTNTSGVSEILDEKTKIETQENYLQNLLKNIEEVPVEEITASSDEFHEVLDESQNISEGEAKESGIGEEEFNGFEEVFFDDGMTEEDGLAAALSGVPLIPLSLAELSDEEKNAMLNMDSLQDERMKEYEPLFGLSTEEVMNTIINDKNGNESKVIDFLEDNNVLTYIPADAIVEVNGEELSRSDFICRKLVPDLISNGRFDFFDYLEANAIDIKYKTQGGTFFPGV